MGVLLPSATGGIPDLESGVFLMLCTSAAKCALKIATVESFPDAESCQARGLCSLIQRMIGRVLSCCLIELEQGITRE